MIPPRIVSLLPSATEMVCALGFRDALVGRSHECDFPADVETLPVCTAPRFDARASSREIDDAVRKALGDSPSIYTIDGELLCDLEPDVVITQAQCEVCAVSETDVRRVVASMQRRPPRIVSLAAASLDGIWTDIVGVGAALGARRKAEDLVGCLRRRIAAVGDGGVDASARPRVLALEWLDPLMAAGNWIPELIVAAGGIPLASTAGRHSDWIDWASASAADPDVLVLLPCGFDLEQVRAETHCVAGLPGWTRLRAVREGRVYLTDGNHYFNRPGPRVADSVEILGEILHPRQGEMRWEGRAWERLT